MTPPASTETDPLDVATKLIQVLATAERENQPEWMDYVFNEVIPEAERNIAKLREIRARGPIQQAPATETLDYAMESETDEFAVFLSEYHLPAKQHLEICVEVNRIIAELKKNDAALIAQEREKWERENPPAAPEKGFSCYACLCGQGNPCSRKVLGCPMSQDFPKACEKIDGEGFCSPDCTIRTPIMDESGRTLYFTCHKKIASSIAQAREDVLNELREAFSHVKADDCFGEMNSDKCHSYNDNGECFLCAFDSIAESLRSDMSKKSTSQKNVSKKKEKIDISQQERSEAGK